MKHLGYGERRDLPHFSAVPTSTASTNQGASTEGSIAVHHVHVGVDYGTSWSKLVFRDYNDPGGDTGNVVQPDCDDHREFRHPSVVTLDANRFWFSWEGLKRAAKGGQAYYSLKIRMAFREESFYADATPLPDGFTSEDLATLFVTYLLDRSARAASEYVRQHHARAEISMNLGVPMTEYDNPQLRDRFVDVVRVARWIQQNELLAFDRGVACEDARVAIDFGRSEIKQASVENPRQWVRSEAESALLWPFNSPKVGAGLYATVDVGAGTTSASFFWISDKANGDGTRSKVGMAFFGASCMPPGADAIDKALALRAKANAITDVRGQENAILATVERDARLDAIVEQIFKTYQNAFFGPGRSYEKNQKQSAWYGCRLFLLGGGSEISLVRGRLQKRVWGQLEADPPLLDPGLPPDLNLGKIPPEHAKFLLVAYGLSFLNADVPSVATPDDIPPFKPPRRREREMDIDAIGFGM